MAKIKNKMNYLLAMVATFFSASTIAQESDGTSPAGDNASSQAAGSLSPGAIAAAVAAAAALASISDSDDSDGPVAAAPSPTLGPQPSPAPAAALSRIALHRWADVARDERRPCGTGGSHPNVRGLAAGIPDAGCFHRGDVPAGRFTRVVLVDFGAAAPAGCELALVLLAAFLATPR